MRRLLPILALTVLLAGGCGIYSFSGTSIQPDEKTVTMAQGVGKKMAQRIILELKDKLGGELDFTAGPGAAPVPVARDSGKLALATAALAELGYTQSEAASALKGADTEKLSVEELVRYGLRAMVMK